MAKTFSCNIYGQSAFKGFLDVCVKYLTPPVLGYLSPLARLLFPAVDDNLLKYNYDDNLRVEPEWYIPILPMILVNGAEGIGTGWSSRIPNYDVREIVSNVHRMLNGEDPLPMVRCSHILPVGLLKQQGACPPPLMQKGDPFSAVSFPFSMVSWLCNLISEY